jgi:hypothetical protein
MWIGQCGKHEEMDVARLLDLGLTEMKDSIESD